MEALLNQAPPDLFFASSKVAKYCLGEQWVFYSPDSFGMPVVVSSLVNHIFEAFTDGCFVWQVLDSIEEFMQCATSDIIECIGFLYTHGFLKRALDIGRYVSTPYKPIQEGESVEVWLHITNYCNLQCSYCFVHKNKSFMSESVMLDTVENLVNTAKIRKLKSMTIKFAGGEPALSLGKMEKFYELLKEKLSSTETKLIGAILTNGTVVTDAFINFIKKNHISISISLDGYGEEGHDIYRVFKNKPDKGSWNIICRNILMLISNNIKPYILATLSEDSVKTLTPLVQWILHNKLRMRLGIVRTPKTIRDNTSESRREAYEGLCDVMIDAFEKMFCELEKNDYPIDVIRRIKICELHFEAPSFTTCCSIGNKHIVIREDGALSNCPMTLKEMAIPQERDILLSVQKTFLHKPEDRNLVETKSCLDCQWFPVCVGGCPVNNDRNKGSPFTISPLHNFYQYVIPRFIKFYGGKILNHAKLTQQVDHHFLLF